MRRHLILLGLLAIAAVTLMAGCSADEIMSAGQTMGSLGSAGLGKAGEKAVSETAKEVEQFIASYESCLKPRTMFTASVGGVEKISFPLLDGALSDTSFFFKSTAAGDDFDGDPRLIALMHVLSADIQSARNTGRSDKPIRDALDARYDGSHSYAPAFKKFGGIIDSWQQLSDLIDNAYTIMEWADILNLIFENPTVESVTNLVRATIDSVRNFDLLIPVQAHDFFMVLDKAINLVQNHFMLGVNIALGNYPPSGGGSGGQGGGGQGGQSGGQGGGGGQSGGSSGFSINDLKYIYDGVVSYVGDRTYQTVGDKMAICLMYDVLDAAKSILDKYVEDNPDEFKVLEDLLAPDSELSVLDVLAGIGEMYSDLDYKWVLMNSDSELDRVISDLTLITYIYDIRIDIPGLIRGLLN